MPMTTKEAHAHLDRQKARIIGCLHATRTNRGLKSVAEATELAKRFAVSAGALRKWESGEVLPPNSVLAEIEAYLSEGPVWRYTAPGRIVGPERWKAVEPHKQARMAG